MKKLLFILLSVFVLFSCSQDEEVNQVDDLGIKSETGFYECTYKGVNYSSKYELINDSTYVFENDKMTKLFENLKGIPTLASYRHSDGSYDFFDNLDELEKNVVPKEEPYLRATPQQYISSIYIAFYEDKKLRGKKKEYSQDYTYYYTTPAASAIPVPLRVPDIGLNVSSMKWSCQTANVSNIRNIPIYAHTQTAVYIYDQPNYQGACAVYSETKVSYKVSELHYFSSEPHPRGNWNDRVRSFKYELLLSGAIPVGY